jgi:hypothetical protein
MSEHKMPVHADKKDRERFAKQWRDDRDHKEKLKNERFAAIQERRKNNKPGGSGGGINIEVSGD